MLQGKKIFLEALVKSRFNTFIHFNDYTLEELLQIFQYTCEKNDYIAEKQVLEKVKEVLSSQLKEKDEQFANGRYVRNLFMTLH
ncbi:hypothetical protein [Lysinibacillus sp. NPDC056185]|uniref:hypothetical protein n=1 Tax=Lysinibacillus sp. NPDC056185 TaxID=3345739 RepID=UPI0039EFF80C